MAGPFFYFPSLAKQVDEFVLDENSSRHIVQVLRMQPGESLHLTDGKGRSARAAIREANKKRCVVHISEKTIAAPPAVQTKIALALLKNTSRFEWFLEKATELGISEIIPLKSSRTEKQQFRMDRMRGILEAALIQSQQVWMPTLHEPLEYSACIKTVVADQKFIAHCEPENRKKLSFEIDKNSSSRFILIGPEGDFTVEEIRQALDAGFTAVELGDNRLRSETAAVAAAVIMKLG